MYNSKWNEIATTVPEYWESYLEEKIGEIHSRHIEAGPYGASFGLITDIHWRTNNKHSAALLDKVLTDCAIPYFFNAGDLFSGQGICKPEENIEEFIEYRKLFHNIESKCLIVEGNHDSVYSLFEAPDYYAQNIPLSEFYEYYFRHQSQYPDRVFGENGTYYYVDIKFQKIRLVVLNTHDIPSDEIVEESRPKYHKFRRTGTGIMQKQLEWFANVALDVPDKDWTVVLCTHESPCEVGQDGVPNFKMIYSIIDAFRRHKSFNGSSSYEDIPHYNAEISVDYTNRGGNFAIWVSGHSHYDKDAKIDGIITTATVNDGMHNSQNNPYEHIASTTSEQAFDIFTIDKKAHKIYATRIGCGVNREFEYEVF